MNTHSVRHHLLSGSSFPNIIGMLYNNRFQISIRYMPRVMYVLATTFLLIPLQIIEFCLYHRKITKTIIPNDPVFIIGHWRSGTTYLHNLLAQDNQFAFPATYQCFLPGVFLTGGLFMKSIHKRNLPPTRPMDNVKMHPDFPQEEEFAMSSLTSFSYYQTLFFPNKMLSFFRCYALMRGVSINKWEREYLYFLKKISYRNQARQLLLKNPVNTVRIKCLLKLFPKAKFIYIHRNKEAVLRSSYKLYSELFRINTFQALALLPKEDILEIYNEMMLQYETQKGYIPKNNLLEISYDDLVTEPFLIICKIYSALNIHPHDPRHVSLKRYISAEASYECNSYH
jgi:omega-hydroxy-beta-dihydromenaquinone-9 sulfotransferase